MLEILHKKKLVLIIKSPWWLKLDSLYKKVIWLMLTLSTHTLSVKYCHDVLIFCLIHQLTTTREFLSSFHSSANLLKYIFFLFCNLETACDWLILSVGSKSTWYYIPCWAHKSLKRKAFRRNYCTTNKEFQPYKNSKRYLTSNTFFSSHYIKPWISFFLLCNIISNSLKYMTWPSCNL